MPQIISIFSYLDPITFVQFLCAQHGDNERHRDTHLLSTCKTQIALGPFLLGRGWVYPGIVTKNTEYRTHMVVTNGGDVVNHATLWREGLNGC